jgi:hypothetical protein
MQEKTGTRMCSANLAMWPRDWGGPGFSSPGSSAGNSWYKERLTLQLSWTLVLNPAPCSFNFSDAGHLSGSVPQAEQCRSHLSGKHPVT